VTHRGLVDQTVPSEKNEKVLKSRRAQKRENCVLRRKKIARQRHGVHPIAGEDHHQVEREML